jgi:phage anti-repressor protein
MEEIIKISKTTIGDSSVNSVSARELHSALGIKTRFNDWFKRQVNKYDFVENLDYVAITQKRVTAQGNQTEYSDYILTIDMAKELAMVENNESGRKIRRYFIEVEKKYRLQLQQPKEKNRDDLISVSDSELDRELKALDFLLNRVHFSEKEKIEFINKTLKKINFQTLENPHLLKHEPVFTLTQLLKDFRVDMRTADFNRKLESYGIIQRFGNGWILLDMKFGENRHFKEGTNHRYYKSTFWELLDLVLKK